MKTQPEKESFFIPLWKKIKNAFLMKEFHTHAHKVTAN